MFCGSSIGPGKITVYHLLVVRRTLDRCQKCYMRAQQNLISVSKNFKGICPVVSKSIQKNIDNTV